MLQNRVLTGNATTAIFLKQLTLLLEHTDLVKLSKKYKGTLWIKLNRICLVFYRGNKKGNYFKIYLNLPT